MANPDMTVKLDVSGIQQIADIIGVLKRENDELDRARREAQARCTELLEENRRLKAQLTPYGGSRFDKEDIY